MIKAHKGVLQVGVSTHPGNDLIATSVVDAQGIMVRVFFHLSTITNTSSAPKENTTCKEEYGELRCDDDKKQP